MDGIYFVSSIRLCNDITTLQEGQSEFLGLGRRMLSGWPWVHLFSLQA